jgi:tripeptidyl-peptidase-1
MAVGKHWTAEQIANTFAPHPKSKNTVLDWLVDSGIDRSRLSMSKGTHYHISL